jgi:Fur family zinc uptake transcriptional regulator
MTDTSTSPVGQGCRPSERRKPSQLDAIILQQLTRAGRPLSAYDIAEAAALSGTPVVPNQVYRTLARMIARGQVHRLEALSAYVAQPGDGDAIVICERCHCVAMLSTPVAADRLACLANAASFKLIRTALELYGRCANCAAEAPGLTR